MPSSAVNSTLHVLRITCDVAAAPAVEFLLDVEGVPYAGWEDREQGTTVVQVFCETPVDSERILKSIENARLEWPAGTRCECALEELAREDWAESWKRFFHADRVSPRIVVKPSWEAWEAEPGDCVVALDPGMSFGTGLHFTTRSCLRFLDALTVGGVVSFCDLGCGSGILSIAAAELGVGEVLAIDVAEDAVNATRENAALNGVGDVVASRVCALDDLNLDRQYPIVAANILATVLRRHVDVVTSAVAADGHLLLAGTTVDDYDDTAQLYRDRGFEEVETVSDETWRSGLLRRGT